MRWTPTHSSIQGRVSREGAGLILRQVGWIHSNSCSLVLTTLERAIVDLIQG